MGDSSRQTPEKQGSHSAALLLSPSRIMQSPSSVGELVDQHKQLRHEAGGLKLQLAAKQEILDRVVDLLDSATAELHRANLTIENQETIIQELQQQLKAAESSGDTVRTTLDTLSERQDKAGTKKEVNHQPQQPPPTTISASAASIKGSAENDSSNKHSDVPLKPFEKLTIDLNELEESIKGGRSSNAKNITADGGVGEEQPLVTPVSARDRIAAFERASREALLLQQRDLAGNKLPELAPQCKITAAARAGSGGDGGNTGGGGGIKGKKKKGKSPPVSR